MNSSTNNTNIGQHHICLRKIQNLLKKNNKK